MEINKKEGKKISFNLSPSSLNVYYKSPLLFYLKYIAKVPDDTQVPICYSLSGSIVHDCLEKYAKRELNRNEVYNKLAEEWNNKNLGFHKNINNQLLNQTEYMVAMIKGMQIIDQHEDHVCEEMISFSFRENEEMIIGLKGIVDLQARQTHDKKQVIIDYKTSNSINSGKDFERQALFYNFLIHKQKNILPSKTVFYYLKLGVPKEYLFTEEHIESFENELHTVAEEIMSHGLNITNYPIGIVDDLFNSKKQACLNEIARREQLIFSGKENALTENRTRDSTATGSCFNH